MEKKEIIVESINVKEALRYLGYNKTDIDPNMKELLSNCEKDLLSVARPDYIYSVFNLKDDYSLEGCDFELAGESIKKHVDGCNKVVFLCVTVGMGVDRLIRKKQIGNMAEATVIDSMASAFVEQVCDQVEKIIREEFPGMEMTWRFGIGYGDFPLNLQKKFLEVLQAPKRIGVCVNDSMMLTPTKSVTCVIGIKDKNAYEDDDTNNKNVNKCDYCNMREDCQFRVKGDSCHGN
ncbi:MAG: methionine synthase [Lachnospiraceae bacterium]|nr:methionine synthase [Lachnospiraceae bacterium]